MPASAAPATAAVLPAQPLDAPFGVTVPHLDLARLDADQAAGLLSLLQAHGLILLRGQCLTDAELARASALLGPVESAANARTAAPGAPTVIYLSNLHDAAGSAVGGLGADEVTWHADQYFRTKPATLSVLHGVLVPEEEGATWWCSTRLGHAALPAELQARLPGLRGWYETPAAATIDHQRVTHPLLLTQPGTGAHSLYVSLRTRGVDGLPEDEGRALLETLLAHTLRPEHMLRHVWRPGDVVLYDNAQTLHRRDGFTQPRFMKATRIFLDPARFAVPD